MSIIKDYKFKDIEKYLKKDSNVGKDIIEAFKHLSDAAIIFAPIILGPKFLILLDLLEVKDKLFDLGHKVLLQKKMKMIILREWNRLEQHMP